MRDDRAEPAGMAGDPVRHVTAEGAAHHRGARLVDLRPRQRRVGDRQDVPVGRAAPLAVTARDERVAVAGRQGRVRQQHGVAVRGHQPRVPPPGPGVPAGQRTAVHPEQQRGRLGGAGGRRQHQPGPDRRSVGGGLDLRQPPGQLERRARAGQPDGFAAGPRGVQPDRGGRLVHRRAQRVDRRTVGGRAQVVVRAVVGGQPGDQARGQVGPEYRAPAMVVGGEVDGA